MRARRMLLLAAVLFLAVSLAGTQAMASTMLRIGLNSDESTLTPYSYVRGDPGYYLLLFVYDTLFNINAENLPEPWLVKDYEWSPDGLVLRMDLHDNITWHDGVPFTAEDVAFTFDYVRRHTHSRWTGPMRIVDKIEVTGPHQLVITLTEPSVGFLYQPLADQPIMPKHIWQDVTDPRAFDGRIGTGPYKLVDYQADQVYRFEANHAYFKGAPTVDVLVMPVIKDVTALFTALKAGEVEAVSRQLSPELVEDFRAFPGMKVVSGPVTLTHLVLMNNRVPPFDNKDFRQAVYLAIDKRDMADTLFLGYAAVGSPGWVHPALPWYLGELDSRPRHDQAQAKRILENLGYRDVNGDGYRQYPNGQAMAFSIMVPSDDPVRVRGAELVTGYLKDVGIKVSVLVLDRATLFSRIGWGVANHDHSEPRNYELIQWGWSAPVQSWPGRMTGVFHSDHARVGTLNLQESSNRDLDSILEQIMSTTDEARRIELARQAQRIIADDVPFVTLFHPDGVYVYNQNAYDGWVFIKGQGIFNKLSFLGEPTAVGAAPTGRAGPSWALILVLLAAAALAVRFARGRRAKAG